MFRHRPPVAWTRPLLPPPAPVRDSDPRAARIIGWTSRYLTAHHAAAEVRQFAQGIDGERDTAFADLVAAVAEPTPVAQHWLKFIKYLEAEGIGQADIQARMRSLAHHVAAEIRDFNDGATRRKVGPTPEYGISRWDELPREFAGFRLVDVDEVEPLAPEPCPLPPAVLIDHFTIGRVTPPMGKNRRETYTIWGRSEEHTSELQSRRNLVCLLLLETKNQPQHTLNARPLIHFA